MADYPTQEKRTIDVKVGETLRLEGRCVFPLISTLAFPSEAFKLEKLTKVPASKIEEKPTDIYVLQALKPGNYEIEYQRFNPRSKANKEGRLVQVHDTEVYHTRIRRL